MLYNVKDSYGAGEGVGMVSDENDRNKDIEDSVHEDLDDRDDEIFVKEHSFSGFKVVLITLGILLLLAVGIAGAGGYYVYSQLQPVDPDNEEIVEIEVPIGTTGTRIATILEENGIIHNEQIFYYYIRYKGINDFQAGEYRLSPNMELDDIIAQLREGRMYSDSSSFTIPEGFTIAQIANRLEENGLADAEEFLRLINEGDFSDVAFVADIPEEVEDRDYRLEGFLFPETYEVHSGATEEDIIRVMLNQFDTRYKSEWYERLAEMEFDFYDMVILASMVERESAVTDEMNTISGVIHNRLDINMLLQIDATIQFMLGEQVDRVLYSHLEIDHPYNTYKHLGLPPGPIAVPSQSALEAALHPEDHEYLFYVTKKDGTREHYFGKTLAEHEQNINKSRENERQREAEAAAEEDEDDNSES